MALDNLGHGEGLAGAGDAEQNLVALALGQARDQLRYGLGLIPGRGVVGHDAQGPAVRLDEGGGAGKGLHLRGCHPSYMPLLRPSFQGPPNATGIAAAQAQDRPENSRLII